VDNFHRRLAQIVFDAGDDLGLVLAGGYAIAMHELTSRPSHDVDFATEPRPARLRRQGRPDHLRELRAATNSADREWMRYDPEVVVAV
jgi:hypothetical protein